MSNERIKEVFNSWAETWDERAIPREEKIKRILEVGEMKEGIDILDVACGTGVMEQFLLKYNPKSIVAVDIAENMIKKAKEKYNDNRIEFICDDIHNIKDRKFDYVIIYNAFPHFLNPDKFIAHVHTLLRENGKFLICHDMGRDQLNNHHNNKKKVSDISLGLKETAEVGWMLVNSFFVDKMVDEDDIYIIYSIKKEK